MEKKKLSDSKSLCAIIMVVLIIAGLLFGGMSSLNRRYERISMYDYTSKDLYNIAASQYNRQLEKFPANLISFIMPVKGPFEYREN